MISPRPSWMCLRVFATVLFGFALATSSASDACESQREEVAPQQAATADQEPQEQSKEKAAAEKKVRADWAEIRLKGTYPEATQMPGLFGDLVESLSMCLDRLQQAGRDKSIKGVLLRISDLEIGWARLHELQTAIRQLRKDGKPVWAYLESGGNKEYLVASCCDRILMPESGTLMLTGLRAEVTFYKNLFEMLDIKAEMLRVGAFKSAAEPYTRTEMSDEFRLEMEAILDDHYQTMVSQIAESRKLSEDRVKEMIDQGLIGVGSAKTLGLVDDVVYEDQILGLMAGDKQSLDVRIREDYKKKKVNTELDLFSLMEIISGGKSAGGSTKPRIVVLRLEGSIVSGSDPVSLFSASSINSDRIVPLIHQLTKDENVKAIVLRVDSPGGSALASDLIWRALEASGKPVIASMSDTAASGGYYISMGAEKIFAEPGTITGSIGVVGGKIALDGLMKKFGVTTSIISRGKNSGVMSTTAGFSDSERETMQQMLNETYEQFTQKAAAGRKMDVAKLEELARGRVYTGRQAKEIGLVDELGTLADAIAEARRLVGDDKNTLELEDLPKAQSPLEMLMGDSKRPDAAPFDVLLQTVPNSLKPALRNLSVLRVLAEERAVLVMPFTMSID
ncbi:MAG: signal peptide peptidase SppA [Planctomycetota bacterium]